MPAPPPDLECRLDTFHLLANAGSGCRVNRQVSRKKNTQSVDARLSVGRFLLADG
jgi:hypothetical protein